MSKSSIPEPTRREIFLAVVNAEDSGEDRGEARRRLCQHFGVSVDQIKEIEAEGIEHSWPPLEPCDDDE